MIAYYFPPMGGSGVQRPLKFAKYLKRFGWEPVILAPEPGVYHRFDETLEQEIADNKIEVHRVPNSPVFRSGNKSRITIPDYQWLSAILKWVTSWFFLPDNKKGWIGPAVEYADKLMQDQDFDAIFATAPPYSNLIIARTLKEKTGIPVVMDLRDDWLDSHFIDYPTRWHYQKMKRLEQNTLESADHLTVVNDAYKMALTKRLPGVSGRISTIHNGFDRDNFLKATPAISTETFKVLYSGRFYSAIRPDWFLKSMRLLLNEKDTDENKIEIQFQGGLDRRHWATINRLGLTEKVTDFGYVNHQTAVQNVVNASILFLTLGDLEHIEAVTPGKVFEYIGSGKPVLAYVPEGATRNLLHRYGAAKCVGIRDVEAGFHALADFYNQWKEGALPEGDADFAAGFERSALTEELSRILDDVRGQRK